MLRFCSLLCFSFFSVFALSADPILVQGRVEAVLPEATSLRLELTQSASADWVAGDLVEFRVSKGDLEIGYADRLIRAEAVHYGKHWYLERVFPQDGAGAESMVSVNAQLHDATLAMKRGTFVKKGDQIPDFSMIDQRGDFIQIKALQGRPFVLNFIFTRCQAATMCPASTTRMAELQEQARADAALADLQFVTITFDPEFDSPGVLRQYAEGYGIEEEDFYLLTGPKQLVDDLLRQFGILTMEEDGTINHTMATLLVDAQGKVAYRKEGRNWTVKAFLKAAKKL